MPITLKDALSTLESGAWCSLRFITANIAKGTGGKVIELAKVRMRKQLPHLASAAAPAHTSSKTKAANHHQHFTRNVETQAGDIIKVHPILITHLNNHPVL
jgi:hypothetical protein